jgi:hypothetical protein
VGVVLAASRGSSLDNNAAPAPPECLALWNDDQRALRLGRHQSLAHGYSRVQVTFISDDGARLVSEEDAEGPQPGATCAVIFAAASLDPEPGANAQIHLRGRWGPLSSLIGINRLALLQREASMEVNATLTRGGDLEPQ